MCLGVAIHFLTSTVYKFKRYSGSVFVNTPTQKEEDKANCVLTFSFEDADEEYFVLTQTDNNTETEKQTLQRKQLREKLS